MPSTEQIVNDIKAILNQIEGDTSLTAQEVGQVKNDTGQILATDQAGFANLSQGLATVIDRENAVISLLEINDEQNRVEICWLEILADLACRQLHQLEAQLEVQRSIERSATNVREILQLVHSREALEVAGRDELTARIDACCPPEQPVPEPCFEPCRGEEPAPYKQKVGPFKPLPQPRAQEKAPG
jgi:hypothetical protein